MKILKNLQQQESGDNVKKLLKDNKDLTSQLRAERSKASGMRAGLADLGR